MSEKRLTYKQKQFCYEYIINGGNGTKAAIKAGYSSTSASSSAYKLLEQDYIKDYIEKISDEALKSKELSCEQIMSKLVDIINGNYTVIKKIKLDNQIYDVEVEPTLTEITNAIKIYCNLKGFSNDNKDDFEPCVFIDDLIDEEDDE